MVNWNSLFSCQRQWPTFLSSSFKSSALHAWPLQAALMAFSHTMLLACPQALSVECNQLTSKYTQPAVDGISINVNIYIYHHITLSTWFPALGMYHLLSKKYIFHQYTWGCNTALYFILFWINKILTFLYTIVGICIVSSNKQPPPIWVQSVIAVKELQLVLTSWATRNTLKMRWSPSGNSNMSRY